MAEEFVWPDPPGQEWFESAGADCGASAQQIRFAAARFGGASASTAARLAGYQGTAASLRSSGYAALRSNGVKRLLQLAAAEKTGSAHVPEATQEEVEKTLAALLRSSDPMVKLRASEQLTKLQASKRGSEPESLRSPDEIIADVLRLEGCVFVACGLIYEAAELPWALAATKLLGPVCKRHYPDLWSRARVKCAEVGHGDAFDELAAGPEFSTDQIIERLERSLSTSPSIKEIDADESGIEPALTSQTAIKE